MPGVRVYSDNSMTNQQKKKRLRNQADKLLQEICRALYKKCLVCGGAYSCGHHFFPKSTCAALRYNLNNIIPVCVKCHCRIHSSDDPTINARIIKIKGWEWLEDLEAIKRNTFTQDSQEYYKKVIENLSKVIHKEEIKLK
jgi:5-methylcytosine-specific restriction endonuclease McrA